MAVATSEEQTAAAAAADAEALLDQDQQEAHGRGHLKTALMVVAPHLVQFVSPKKVAPLPKRTHCNCLGIPKHVIDWYPGIQHGSPLHLQVKVPAAAEELALMGGTCSVELGGTRASLTPVEEAPVIVGGGAHGSVHTKLVSALVGTLADYSTRWSFIGSRQTLDHFLGWRIVCMEKVSLYPKMG